MPVLLVGMGWATPAFAASHEVFRALDRTPSANLPPAVAASVILGCDDGTSGGSLIQRLDDYYGNEFRALCAGAWVRRVTFVYTGAGTPGPYRFRLHWVDAGCGLRGSTGVLEVPGTADSLGVAAVDVGALGWCVQETFRILLEPLTCADGLAGQDCFPALVTDASSGVDAAAHCARVRTSEGLRRTCRAARSADGRFFDFRMRVELECDSTRCATAVTPVPWGLLKRRYRDATP